MHWLYYWNLFQDWWLAFGHHVTYDVCVPNPDASHVICYSPYVIH